MKKAIFGGSFDPPHLGHLDVIKQALITLDIDELILMPAFLNPFKQKSYAPASLRLKWLKKMTKDLKSVHVSSFEIDHNRSVPSIETVKYLKNDKDKIYFIIGADNLKDLSKWNSFKELNQMLTWVVACRDGIDIPSEYIQLDVNRDISATLLREEIIENQLDSSVSEEIKAFYSNKK